MLTEHILSTVPVQALLGTAASCRSRSSQNPEAERTLRIVTEQQIAEGNMEEYRKERGNSSKLGGGVERGVRRPSWSDREVGLRR